MKHRAFALLAICALVVSACSSTAQNADDPTAIDIRDQGSTGTSSTDGDTATGVDPDGDGVSFGVPTGETAGDGGTTSASTGDTTSGGTTTGGTTSGSTTGETTTGGTTTGGTTSGGTTSGGTPPAQAFAEGARGVTDTEIHIGFEFLTNAQETNEALYGAGAVERGDPEKYHQIMTDYINETGGILGRRLVPYYRAYDANDQRDRSTIEQAACTDFTEDHELFAVVTTISHSDLFRQCLAESGTGHIASEGLGTSDDGVFNAFANYVETNTWSSSLLHRVWVEGLDDAGYFAPEAATGETRLGFVTFDDPRAKRALEDHFKPTLKARGHADKLIDVQYLSVPQNQADTGTLAAQINNAILRFQSQQIDHVMLVDVSGTTTLLWMRAAEAQNYYPQYGLTSQNAGQVLASLVNTQQLVGAMTVGWLPFVDVPASEDDIMWPGRKRCRDIVNAGGFTINDASRNAERVATVYCDAYLFLRAALEGAPTPIAGPVELRKGATAVGSGFEGASTYVHRYSASKRYGASAYRITKWDVPCQCYRYTTKPKVRMP